jgi:hypothetical protein
LGEETNKGIRDTGTIN